MKYGFNISSERAKTLEQVSERLATNQSFHDIHANDVTFAEVFQLMQAEQAIFRAKRTMLRVLDNLSTIEN